VLGAGPAGDADRVWSEACKLSWGSASRKHNQLCKMTALLVLILHVDTCSVSSVWPLPGLRTGYCWGMAGSLLPERGGTHWETGLLLDELRATEGSCSSVTCTSLAW
jgi:hypothetical protein